MTEKLTATCEAIELVSPPVTPPVPDAADNDPEPTIPSGLSRFQEKVVPETLLLNTMGVMFDPVQMVCVAGVANVATGVG